jgi:hypothetical protein
MDRINPEVQHQENLPMAVELQTGGDKILAPNR